MRALFLHFRTTLLLNLRSKQALVYGYVVPIFFLLAFGSVFRTGTPALLEQIGQLVTITVLGGACFGLPTAIVSERERGVWRRYRLLPQSTIWLVFSTLGARLVIVMSAVLLQLALAHYGFGTPWPLNPWQSLAALACTAFAFLGIGLIVAAIARDVPAVQALGQCLFLPMIMIGGVGVPLAVLPEWAQRVAAFMPGKYAVDAIQQAYSQPDGLRGAGFSLVVLLVIGAASCAIGAKIFRWETEQKIARGDRAWAAAAIGVWLAVGGIAAATGRISVKAPGLQPSQITDELVASIRYDDLTGDDELVTRLAPPYETIEERYKVLPIAEQIRKWAPAQEPDRAQRVKNLLSLAALADIHADLREADFGRVIFDHLRSQYANAELRKILAWTVLAPEQGTVITAAPEFGFKRELKPEAVRQRSGWYAQKYLGRLTGQLKEPVRGH